MKRQNLIRGLRKLGKNGDVPNISADNQSFLLGELSKRNTTNLLEIGTANGLSSIIFGDYLERKSGRVTTIEFSALSVRHARNNIKSAGLSDTIEVIEGNALDILKQLQSAKQSYDFIFIDGMKRRSLDFLQLSIPLLIEGGVIIIDDVIKFKSKMMNLYKYLDSNDIAYKIVQTDPDDGVMILEYSNIL